MIGMPILSRDKLIGVFGIGVWPPKQLGDAEQALGYVQKAIDAGLRNRRQYESDGDLASLRELPRFREMMQRL